MKKIFLFGECMVELRQTAPGAMQQSFAGDVFNTAVYLKRVFNEIDTQLVTAIGKDVFSENMLSFFHQEHISTDFVFQSEDKIPGLYSIQTDAEGERSFTYWRDNSAAKEVMLHIDDEIVAKLSLGDIFFFSGISLAVIKPEHRDDFWSLITRLKSNGVEIIFDPNYRARMWDSPQQAKDQFEKAFECSATILPGVDDFEQLYGLTSVDEVFEFCQKYNFKELIIKNGEQGILCAVDNKLTHFAVEPIKNVVDTTSAGDSFNGLYLGARMSGLTVAHAIELATQAAGFVIQHKGAIVPYPIFAEFITQQLSLPTR